MKTPQTILSELLLSAGFDNDSIEVCDGPNQESVRLNIKTGDSGLLIGKNGEVLLSLNHIFKNMVLKHSPETKITASVDVNNYKARQEENIKAKALMLAERARFFKRDIDMEPMNAYDRMLVHTVFSETLDIKTESSGYGRERHVVIKYQAGESDILSSEEERTSSFRI